MSLRDDLQKFREDVEAYLARREAFVLSGVSDPTEKTWLDNEYLRLEARRITLNWRLSASTLTDWRSGFAWSAIVIGVLTIIVVVAPYVIFTLCLQPRGSTLTFNYNIDLVTATIGAALAIIAAFAAAAYARSAGLSGDGDSPAPIPAFPKPPAPEEMPQPPEIPIIKPFEVDKTP